MELKIKWNPIDPNDKCPKCGQVYGVNDECGCGKGPFGG